LRCCLCNRLPFQAGSTPTAWAPTGPSPGF